MEAAKKPRALSINQLPQELLVVMVDATAQTAKDARDAMARIAASHVGARAFFADKAEVAVIVFGSKGTNNKVNSDAAEQGYDGQFEHVTVIGRDADTGTTGLAEARLGTAAAVREALLPQNCCAAACWMDAFVVALDLVHTRTQELFSKLSGPGQKTVAGRGGRVVPTQRILLLTAGDTAASLAGSGKTPSATDAGGLMTGLANIGGADVVVALAGGKEMGGAALDREMFVSMGATVIGLNEALREAETPRVRPAPKPTATARTELQLGPHARIPVFTYYHTKKEPFPSMQDYYTKANMEGATGAVTKDTEYHIKEAAIEDEYKPLERADMIDGFKYGHQIVPVDDNQAEALKFDGGPASLKLLGFPDKSLVSLSHAYGQPEVMTAPPGDNAAAAALSALVRAADIEGCVVAMRFVRKDAVTPQLCVGVPCVAIHDLVPGVTPDCLLLYKLPYVDSIRFLKRSPQIARKRTQPTDSQQAASDALVSALMLPDDAGPTPLKVVNPIIHRLFCEVVEGGARDATVEAAGKDAGSAWVLQSIVGQCDLFDAATAEVALGKFTDSFPVQRKKTKTRGARDDEVPADGAADPPADAVGVPTDGAAAPAPTDGAPTDVKAVEVAAAPDNAASRSAAAAHIVIERRDPSGDFRRAINGADAPTIEAALLKGREVVLVLTEESSEHFDRAGELLVAVREASASAGVAAVGAYNAFVQDVIAARFSAGRRRRFWTEQVVARKAGLITKLEAEGGAPVNVASALLEGGAAQREEPKVEEAQLDGDDMFEDMVRSAPKSRVGALTHRPPAALVADCRARALAQV